jgi:hypothetical protein
VSNNQEPEVTLSYQEILGLEEAARVCTCAVEYMCLAHSDPQVCEAFLSPVSEEEWEAWLADGNEPCCIGRTLDSPGFPIGLPGFHLPGCPARA